MLGEIVGGYRITGQIGAGGMGAVYEAEHLLLGRRAAVKVLLPERSSDKETIERFFNEARATSRIKHPGVVEIFDYGHLDNGKAFIVMELLEGESLGARLDRVGKFSSTQSVSIARHIAGLLGEAHRHGIIHRDLKPDNVFLVPDPAMPRGERAKVLDFGIAKLANDEEGMGLQTQTGTLMGTPSYMSPEQCRGAGGVDHRSDIYALGYVLYQMLCGRPPFLGKGSGEVLAAHIHVPPKSVRVYEDSVSTTLEAVVMRLLEKDVDKRYQTMAEVIQALNSAAPAGAGTVEPSLAASGHFVAMETEPDHERVAFVSGTTLSSTARESAEYSAVAAPKGPVGITAVKAVLGLALVAATVTAVLLLQGDDKRKKPALATPGPVEQASQAPALVEATPPKEIKPVEDNKKEEPTEANPDAPTEVVLTIESDPPGARVYRQSDGVRVGETPFDLTVRKGRGVAAFYLKKSGYRRASLELSTDEDARVMTPLERRGVKDEGTGEADSKPGAGDEKPVDKKPVDEKPVDEKPVDEKPVETTPGRNDAIDPFGQPAKSVGSEP